MSDESEKREDDKEPDCSELAFYTNLQLMEELSKRFEYMIFCGLQSQLVDLKDNASPMSMPMNRYMYRSGSYHTCAGLAVAVQITMMDYFRASGEDVTLVEDHTDEQAGDDIEDDDEILDDMDDELNDEL